MNNYRGIFAILLLSASLSWASVPFEQGMVSITFDDGWLSQHTLGRDMLQQAGVPATFYLNVNPFNGWSGFMQEAEVFDLIADGHEIGGHTVSHPDLPYVDDATLDYELEFGRNNLLARFGLTSMPSFATPYGSYDDRVVDAISKYHSNHRTTMPGLNWKDGDPLRLKGSDVGYYSIAEVKAMMDAAAASDGWLILVAHELTTGIAPTPLDYNVDDMAALFDYAKSLGLQFVTVADGTAMMDSTLPPPAVPNEIDDFDDLDLASNSGNEWFGYTDVWSSGNSVLDLFLSFPGADNSAGALSFGWELNSGTAYPYVGAGVSVSGSQAANANGITLTSRGSGLQISLVMGTDATQNGYASYSVELPSSDNWITTTIPWSAFSLPTWSPNSASTYPLTPSAISSIEFAPPASASAGTSGLTEIDDLAFNQDTIISVSLDGITEGDVLSGTVKITAAANGDIDTLSLSINGVNVSTGPGNSIDWNWDTTAVDDGSYTILAEALDSEGDVIANTSASVEIDNIVEPGILIDDGEDGNNINKLGGYWFTYSDSSSTISPAAGSAFSMSPTSGFTGADGNLGAGITWSLGSSGYLGMGTSLNPSGTATDISSASRLEFSAAGSGTVDVVLTMDTDSSQNGWSSYEARFKVDGSFSNYSLSWNQFALPSWSPNSEADYPLDLTRIKSIEFVPATAGSGQLIVDTLSLQ